MLDRVLFVDEQQIGVTARTDSSLARKLQRIGGVGGDEREDLRQGQAAGFSTRPHLFEQVWACAETSGLSLSQVLSFVTANTADALKLPRKGRIRPGCDADLLFVDEEHSIQHGFALGRPTISNGEQLVRSTFDQSPR